MDTRARLAADRLALESPGPSRRRDHRFFSGMALATLAVVLVGFAPTYYLGPLFAARPVTPLVHLHAAIFTLWTLLFVSQTSLVAVGRTDLHRRLGVAGGALAVAMVLIGYATAVESARLGTVPPGRTPIQFLSVPLGTLAVFVVLVATGLRNRSRSEFHKRLMLLATISLMTPAFARMRFIGDGGPPVALAGTALMVAGCWIYDRSAHEKIHPAFLWGGLFVVLTIPARFAVGTTEPWQAFARWLTGLP